MADSQSPDTTDADDAEPTDGDGEQNDHHDSPNGHGRADHGDNHEHHDHGHHHAGDLAAVGVGVVTVSSSRSLDDDPSGDAIAAAFEADGHEVVTRELVRDDYDRVQAIVNRLVGRDDVNVVVTTGGTGVTPDDRTVEAVRPLLEKRLPGFGELFRRRYHESVGTDVIATRATAGIVDGTPVFCLPGSVEAARLGTSEIVAEQVGRLSEPGDDPTA